MTTADFSASPWHSPRLSRHGATGPQTFLGSAHFIFIIAFMWLRIGGVSAQTASLSNHTDMVVLPRSVPDPIEPFNRVMWSFNKELMTDVIKPTSRLYRFVVRPPIRTGIGNFGRNITYPGRLVNNLLQGRWTGAHNETDRFLYNTFAGGLGFVDVASRYNVPKSDADFGQTFGHWGWKPHCYLMLPFFGPSNERDTLGLASDNAANPLMYITPYSVTADNPLTYLSPYTYFSYGVIYNNLSDSVDGYARFAKAETDPYSLVQYAWTFVRKNRTPDFQLKEEPDASSLETLQSAFVSFKDPKFLDRGKTRSVSIPTTGRKLKFTCWLQPKRAPIAYIVPGLGSHRLAENALALAELVYQNGFSAVCVSSPYNSEFMEHASTAALPAYAPVDARDLHVALTAIHRSLEKRHPGRLGATAVMGYSMGGFQSLLVASAAATNDPPLLAFDRCVAIDAPVRLLYGVSKLDEFYNAPLAWPRNERTDNIENLFLKIAASTGQGNFKSQTAVPLGSVESKFLIGLTFRFILRDVIYSSQRRNNLGVLQHSIGKLRREPVYEEIMQYSFSDYFQKFAVPYYQSRGIDLTTPEALEKAGDLRTYAADLRDNSRLHVIVNQNDFLLSRDDLAWLRTTIGSERLTVFERGGHLGNLGDTNVQSTIIRMLSDLR